MEKGRLEQIEEFLTEMLVTVCSANVSDAGKILVDLYDEGPAGVGHRDIDLTGEIDALASGEVADAEVMEAWAIWLEQSARKMRKGLDKRKDLDSREL